MAARFDLSAMQLVAQHRRVAVDHCVEALAHSCLCVDAYCRLPACSKMKRVVIHTNICTRKHKGTCPVCKQLIALCCYHANSCKETRCVVPFCNTVKQKMRRQRAYERLRTARNLPPDEPDEIDVNILGGVSGWTWRMIRVVPSPTPMENSDDGEGQAPVREPNGPSAENSENGVDQAPVPEINVLTAENSDDGENEALVRENNGPDADDNDSGDSNIATDNNNIGENNDTTDTSSDEGPNEPNDPEEIPANGTAEEQSDSTESE